MTDQISDAMALADLLTHVGERSHSTSDEATCIRAAAMLRRLYALVLMTDPHPVATCNVTCVCGELNGPGRSLCRECGEAIT